MNQTNILNSRNANVNLQDYIDMRTLICAMLVTYIYPEYITKGYK